MTEHNGAPILTVGLPVYNGQRYLATALDSIQGQSFTDFELVISDNGSTDATREICADYAARDPRLRYVRFDRNMGAARNYNRVAVMARGKYFRWASHDDVVDHKYFECCVEELEAHPNAVLCYPRTLIIDENGEPVRMYDDGMDLRNPEAVERFEEYLNIYRKPHSCNAVFGIMRTHVLKKTPLIGSYVSSDMILLGELVLNGEIHELPETMFFRRDHPKASVRAHPAYRDRIAWFDPELKGRLQLTKWRWLVEYVRAIGRSPLSGREKMRCYQLMARWSTWNMTGLGKDLMKAGLWPFVQAYLAMGFEHEGQESRGA
ncbi:MAG: glycosyltransferase family 2 protein [Chloroflexota bacterium]|nr:MAG: glycosyltransferase family 2 protein [Chloroflexota bacterium]